MARPAPKPRKYEMMIVVAPTVTEDGLPNVVERVNGLIEAQEGTIESFTHDSPWGHRRLAYPIQNFRDAFYVLYYFDAVPSAITELDRELRLDEAIIRHLIVKFDPLTVREIDGDEDEPEADETDDSSDDAAGEERAAAASEAPSETTDDAAAESGSDAGDDSDGDASDDSDDDSATDEDESDDNGEDTEEEEE